MRGKKTKSAADILQEKNQISMEEELTKIKIPSHLQGLSANQISERIEQGLTNMYEEKTVKSTWKIIRENTFTLFNLINLVLAGLVFFVGSPQNAIFLFLIATNSIIGIYQELKAKRTIEKLSLIARVKVPVLREGKLQLVTQDELVLDDYLFLKNGDQVPVDGEVLQTDSLEVDESLLTGESDRIHKKIGEELYSGSLVTAGQCFYKVNAVGKDTYVAKLTNEAKVDKGPTSQLMMGMKRMIRVLTIAIIPIGAGLFYSQLQNSHSIQQAVLGSVAALISMIPEGLVLLTSVAFAVGAANLAKKNVLVQSLPGIETLARVSTICLDKTGTITDGTLELEKLIVSPKTDEAFVKEGVTELMHALPDDNATAKTLREFFLATSPSWKVTHYIPFSSARKWSGATFEEKGSFVIGAPEFIYKTVPPQLKKELQHYLEEGYRVLIMVHFKEPLTEILPDGLEYLAAFVISDNLRADAQATFSYFEKQQVKLKVISGDHPQTVSKIAEKAGIKNATHFVDMSQVGEDADFQLLVEQNSIFGRVSPYQKRSLIKALKSNGHITSMVGDGVNDVLALREADIGIAMANGSTAARSAADIILLDSNFAVMSDVLNEGRRVINNIERVASMYLVKTIYSVCLALIFMILQSPYPFAPLQLSPTNTLTVGIPSFFLALRPSYERIKGNFLNNILRHSVPGALTVIICILILHFIGIAFDLTFEDVSTMSALLTGCVGLQVLVRVSRPLDQRKKVLIGALTVAFIVCFVFFNKIFMLASLFNRNAFFYMPLVLGIRSIFNYVALLMGYVIYWRKRSRKR